MTAKKTIQTNSGFASYRLDVADQRLWHGAREIALTPKAFDLLRYLAENPNRLLSKQELLDQVWPDSLVADNSLKAYIKTLRRALGDGVQTQRFIETVRGRGYRFIGDIKISGARKLYGSATEPPTLPAAFVGRVDELAMLNTYLEQTRAGQRNVVFISGEPGIGKTTLLDVFIEQVANDNKLWIVRGQCVEQSGAGDALLPLLEALGELCTLGGQTVIEDLSRYAPSWLLQLPWVISEDALQALQRKAIASGQERLLREIAQAIEQITQDRTLILCLEDLHWSDYSTLAVISYLARRRQAAKLLLLATFRPEAVSGNDHPVMTTRQELLLHKLCRELQLPLLNLTATNDYLASRFPGHQFPAALTERLFQHTDGNPLFMVNIIDDWLAQKAIIYEGDNWRLAEDKDLDSLDARIPQTLIQLIEYQSDRLDADDQQALEAASVVGVEFSTAAVAAGLQISLQTIEDRCERLARRGQFLRPATGQGWPDGTIASSYRFIHALYQQVAYERIATGRRIVLHRRIGERLEQAYQQRPQEVTVELAMHFAAGEESERAIEYSQQAAELALRQHAQREAISHLSTALNFLDKLPDTPARKGREAGLQLMLGMAQAMMRGFAAAEAEKAHARAYELCQQLGAAPQLFRAAGGLWMYYFLRGDLQKAQQLAEQQLVRGKHSDDLSEQLNAYQFVISTSMHCGELNTAKPHIEHSLATYNIEQCAHFTLLYGQDAGVAAHCYAAWALWLSGYPDQAAQKGAEAITLAQQLDYPVNQAFALALIGMLYQFRGEVDKVQQYADAVFAIAIEYDYAQWLGMSVMQQGWAKAMNGDVQAGIGQIQQGLAGWRASGSRLSMPHNLLLLAEAQAAAAQTDEALNTVTEALAISRETGEHFLDAELLRLQGELILRSDDKDADVKAERYYQNAIDIAKQQQSKAWQLRATVSLSKLWRDQGKAAQAYRQLKPIYESFSEGLSSPDLGAAKDLMDTLQDSVY